MLHILLGIGIMAIGFLFVAKSEWLLSNFGSIPFFEQHLGTEGGSRLGYKLIGLAVIFIGLLVLTDQFGGFIRWVLSPLTKYNQP